MDKSEFKKELIALLKKYDYSIDIVDLPECDAWINITDKTGQEVLTSMGSSNGNIYCDKDLTEVEDY